MFPRQNVTGPALEVVQALDVGQFLQKFVLVGRLNVEAAKIPERILQPLALKRAVCREPLLVGQVGELERVLGTARRRARGGASLCPCS